MLKLRGAVDGEDAGRGRAGRPPVGLGFPIGISNWDFQLGFPVVKELGYGLGCHFAHVLELLVSLRKEQFALRVEDSERGYTFVDGNLILLRDLDVVVVLADVDVDQDELLIEQCEVWRLVEVDVEDLAVAAPVAAEVEDDALVFAAGLGECGVDVRRGVGGLGVEVLVDLIDDLRGGLSRRRGCEDKEKGREERVAGLRDRFLDHGLDLIRVHRDDD
jgi:hypothetical protein